jgi:hypothetical protein
VGLDHPALLAHDLSDEMSHQGQSRCLGIVAGGFEYISPVELSSCDHTFHPETGMNRTARRL